MKKLMVLALVLGVVGLVNAGYSFKVNDADYAGPVLVQKGLVTIILKGDAATQLVGGLYGLMPVSADVIGPAGNLAGITFYPEYDGFDYLVDGTNLGGQDSRPKDGDWMKFVYDIQKDTVLSIYDYAVSFDNPVGTIDLKVIPEPMTMGLLALGGLFIRRKK